MYSIYPLLITLSASTPKPTPNFPFQLQLIRKVKPVNIGCESRMPHSCGYDLFRI